MRDVNVLIVGGGPAGLFAAYDLARSGVKGITILDSGPRVQDRECPLTEICSCQPCDVLEGIGGSGGVSDGKLTFDLMRGTQTEQVFDPAHRPLLGYVRGVMENEGLGGVRYDADETTGHVEEGIRFETYPLWHIGSDGIRDFSERFSRRVTDMGVSIASRARADDLVWDGDRVDGAWVRVRRGHVYDDVFYRADRTILATGIFGIGWLESQLRGYVKYPSGPGGIGLRVEASEYVLAPLFRRFYDWKATGTFNGVTLRSFCCNARGLIMPEYHRHLGIRNVNGHSYLDPARRTDSSNFSLQAKLVPGMEQLGGNDPKLVVRDIARGMNALSGGWQVRQSAANFVRGGVLFDAPTPDFVTYPQARVADVRSALPDWLGSAFSQYLVALDRIAPGLIDSAWVYGPEVKYHARRLPIDRDTWQVDGVEGLHVIGDSTGLTGSYVSAALTGILAARSIADLPQNRS